MVSWFEVQRRARACPLRSFSLGEKVAEGRGRMRGHFVRRSCARQNKFTSSQEPPINEAGECWGHSEGARDGKRDSGRVLSTRHLSLVTVFASVCWFA